jgi:hypothetical protein
MCEQVLLNTATAFLQGLPPLEIINATPLTTQSINNGSSYTKPLNGYQYVVLHGEESMAPDTIWIKGGEGCPMPTKVQKAFENSSEYTAIIESTRPFYQQFWDVLKNVYDYTPDLLSYDKAYDIFDLINVATVHNTSLASNVTTEQLFQLRTLADSAEFGYNYNRTQTARSIGGQTLISGIFSQLNQAISSKGKLKFSLLAGSYDNFLAAFGLLNLTSANSDFFGLPQYASTIAFEMFTCENATAFPAGTNDLFVRFLFEMALMTGRDLRPPPPPAAPNCPSPEKISRRRFRRGRSRPLGSGVLLVMLRSLFALRIHRSRPRKRRHLRVRSLAIEVSRMWLLVLLVRWLPWLWR